MNIYSKWVLNFALIISGLFVRVLVFVITFNEVMLENFNL